MSEEADNDELLGIPTELPVKFNESQMKAIEAAALTTEGFCLVQGPPGTGKTSTILGMLSIFLERKAGTRILLCTSSNAAVDEIATRILRDGVLSSADPSATNLIRLGAVPVRKADNLWSYVPKIVRIGLGKDVPEDLKPLALEAMVQERIDRAISHSREKYTKLASPVREMRRKFEIDILDKAAVVFGTLSSMGSKSLSELNKTFDVVIIDEAAQAVELSTLIPLKYNCKTCVLVGDPQQLPATVMSQKAVMYNYDQSLMLRIIKSYAEAEPNKDIIDANGVVNFSKLFDSTYPNLVMLKKQYRMHSTIREFPSSYFYNDRLIDGANVLSDEYIKDFHSSPTFMPFLFYNVKNASERKGGPAATGFSNQQEAQFVAELLDRFYRQYPQHLGVKVGIITPYRQQVNLIKRTLEGRLRHDSLANIEVNSVDGFQGREKDIVILSTVRAQADSALRTSNSNTIGFLADIRRMNVALTRAKYALWVVGNSRSLIMNAHWKKFIDQSSERDFTFDVDDVFGFWRDIENRMKLVKDSLQRRIAFDPAAAEEGEIPDDDAMNTDIMSPNSILSSSKGIDRRNIDDMDIDKNRRTKRSLDEVDPTNEPDLKRRKLERDNPVPNPLKSSSFTTPAPNLSSLNPSFFASSSLQPPKRSTRRMETKSTSREPQSTPSNPQAPVKHISPIDAAYSSLNPANFTKIPPTKPPPAKTMPPASKVQPNQTQSNTRLSSNPTPSISKPPTSAPRPPPVSNEAPRRIPPSAEASKAEVARALQEARASSSNAPQVRGPQQPPRPRRTGGLDSVLAAMEQDSKKK